jgi:hypothetical protein
MNGRAVPAAQVSEGVIKAGVIRLRRLCPDGPAQRGSMPRNVADGDLTAHTGTLPSRQQHPGFVVAAARHPYLTATGVSWSTVNVTSGSTKAISSHRGS